MAKGLRPGRRGGLQRILDIGSAKAAERRRLRLGLGLDIDRRGLGERLRGQRLGRKRLGGKRRFDGHWRGCRFRHDRRLHQHPFGQGRAEIRTGRRRAHGPRKGLGFGSDRQGIGRPAAVRRVLVAVAEGGGAPVGLTQVVSLEPRGFADGLALRGPFGPARHGVARIGQELRRAFLGQAHPLGQFARGPVVALLDPLRAVGQFAPDLFQGLGRLAFRLGDPVGEPIGDAGDLSSQLLEGDGVLVLGPRQPLLHRLGIAAHVAVHLFRQFVGQGRGDAVDLARQGVGQTIVAPGAVGLHLLDATVQVLGDAQDFAAHGLDTLGRALFGGLERVADGQDGALEPTHPAFVLGGVQPAHHVGAVGLDLATQGLGQFLEAGGLAAALGLDPALGGAQPLIQPGEGTFQTAQSLGGPGLGVVEAGTDLGQQVRADPRPRRLLDRIHAGTQFVGPAALALLDVIQARGQGPEARLDLAEGRLGLGPDLLFEGAQAAVALAQFLGDVVKAAALRLCRRILAVETTDQTRDGLIDTLNGHRRAPLGGFEAGGDGVDRGGDTVQHVVRCVVRRPARPVIGVVQPTRAPAPIDALGGVRTTGQRRVGLVVLAVIHDHGVEPLAQRHAGATGEVLGDFTRLGVDALYAPRRSCAH